MALRRRRRRHAARCWIEARRCTTCSIDRRVPLKRLVAVTGVSGSGKSTLARDVLLANLQFINRKAAGRDWQRLRRHRRLAAVIDRVLEVDQTPIGKTPRSCPATYIGFWDTIRKLFAETLEARARGYAPNRFSSTPAKAAARPAKGRACRRSR